MNHRTPSLRDLRLSVVLAATAPALATGPVAAETTATAAADPIALETVIVEGTRLPAPLREVGSSVTVLTEADLELAGFDFLPDALARVPGVTVNQNGAFGGTSTVRIRGAASEQTLVLLDGIPVNDPASPGGGFDFARIDPAQIERVEVLRGPHSTLWGTDAIGGVVSIVTRRPEPGLGGAAFAEGGSFGTFRAGASVEGGDDRGDFRLGVSGMTSDGISRADEDAGNTEADGYESRSLSARGGVELPRGARLDATVLYTDGDTDFDRFDFTAPGSIADGDERTETEELTGHLALTVPTLDDRLEHLLVAGHARIDRQNFTDGVAGFSAEGRRDFYRYQGTWRAHERARIAFGAEREEVSADDADGALDGYFALAELKPLDDLTVSAGLRHDDSDRFGSETTARLGAAWAATDAITVRASWGQGFKAPTIFQTTYFCCGATAPDPDLQAETSDAFDLGVAWQDPAGRARAALTAFRQETDNQIDFAFAVGGYQNIARVEATGLEFSGAVAVTPWLDLTLDYAWIDAEDGDGNALRRIPEQTADLALVVNEGGAFSGRLLVRHNGEEPEGTTDVPAWTRVDLTGQWRPSERLEVFARIENLLDEAYQQVLGYGTPDLSGSVGVRVRW
jgi:vitamin B12 transporter